MSTRDPAGGDEGSKQTADRRLNDEQLEEITRVVLQAIESWSKAKEQDAKQKKRIRRAVGKARTGFAWIIAHLTAIVLLLSILTILVGIFLYDVSPDQIVKGSITPYQEAQLKEDIVQRQLDMGQRLLNIGKPQAARVEFEKALELDPENTTAELGIMKCDLFIPILEHNYSLEIMEQKVQLLESSTKHDTHTETFLGNIYQRFNPQEAIRHYNIAIDKDSRNAHAYYGLGTVYEAQGELDKALDNYREAKDRAAWNPLYLQAEAYALYQQGQYRRAQAKYNYLVQWEPQYIWAYSDLALINQLLGHTKRAGRYQEQLLTLLKDEDLVSMEKNSGLLAFNTRQGPMYLSQTFDKLYYVYYNAAWTSHLLGEEENTNQYIQEAEDKGIDADRESEIKQILDDNITTLLSEQPQFASRADDFRSKFISHESTSIGKGTPQDKSTLVPKGKLDSDERAAYELVRDHYEAIGERQFEEAYSYFGPDYQDLVDKATWIEKEKSYHIDGSTVNSLEVAEVEDETATATVDVTFEDDSGTPRFLITWSLVRGEDEKWKLNKELFTLRLN
jgi:tetratricopeptide (TPR) repeat protein